jgi:competence ComEA-like helix-hairpin-helix protein
VPGERLSFQKARPAPKGTSWLFAALLLAAMAVAGLRAWLSSSAPPEGIVVEVRGDLPRPGYHLVHPPTVAEALREAGGPSLDDDRVLSAGAKVQYEGGVIELLPPSEPLLVGIPLDLNEAGASQLDAIPEVSRSLAERIVADREQRGPFRRVEDLSRVPGVGAQAMAVLGPFVTVGEVPPTDLNTASASELELLPGVGPVLAARIVVERADGGPFRSLEELSRVDGIGPALIEKLRAHAIAESP